VKLLLDHNVSHKLVARLADVFPDSTHMRLLNFGRTNDPQLWLFAKMHGYVFVTKDSDFAELVLFGGAAVPAAGPAASSPPPR
jgi:predicted nuclease of predicted toxin-antitoxin system